MQVNCFKKKYPTYRIEMSIINIQSGPRKIIQHKVNEEQFGSLPIGIWNGEDVFSMTYEELSSIILRTLRNGIRKSTGGIPIPIEDINK